MSSYQSIVLSEDEMAALDDGQGWYEPGDEVTIGGYVDTYDGLVDLTVNGEGACDGWTTWDELPASIRSQAFNPVYGHVIYNGNAYWLTEQAERTNHVFPGWWGDAEEDEEYTDQWSAHAFDANGNERTVYWQFTLVKGEEIEDEDLPWTDDNITEVR